MRKTNKQYFLFPGAIDSVLVQDAHRHSFTTLSKNAAIQELLTDVMKIIQLFNGKKRTSSEPVFDTQNRRVHKPRWPTLF